LHDPAAPTNTWRLRGGIDFDFPTGLTLEPNGHLVLASFDPALRPGDLRTFRTVYGIGPEVLILGPYQGRLDNTGESVRLLRPDPPQTLPGPEFGLVPYILVDQVDFSHQAPWPTDANATGKSIERRVSGAYGNDPANWQSASPTPGSSLAPPDLDSDGDGLPDTWESAHGLDPNSAEGDDGATGDPDGDGLTNREEFVAGTHPNDPLSTLRVEAISAQGNEVRLRLRVVAGRSYTILQRDAVDHGVWTPLTHLPVQPESVEVEIRDTATSGTSPRFYRVVTPQQ
jgi:hypothetical protein